MSSSYSCGILHRCGLSSRLRCKVFMNPTPYHWQDEQRIVRLTAEDAIGRSVPHTSLMYTSLFRYHRHRFPAEIISHSVWLYFRFALRYRDVEEMLAMRGVTVSYETVREW
jgi:hypothetical protein